MNNKKGVEKAIGALLALPLIGWILSQIGKTTAPSKKEEKKEETTAATVSPERLFLESYGYASEQYITYQPSTETTSASQTTTTSTGTYNLTVTIANEQFGSYYANLIITNNSDKTFEGYLTVLPLVNGELAPTASVPGEEIQNYPIKIPPHSSITVHIHWVRMANFKQWLEMLKHSFTFGIRVIIKDNNGNIVFEKDFIRKRFEYSPYKIYIKNIEYAGFPSVSNKFKVKLVVVNNTGHPINDLYLGFSLVPVGKFNEWIQGKDVGQVDFRLKGPFTLKVGENVIEAEWGLGDIIKGSINPNVRYDAYVGIHSRSAQVGSLYCPDKNKIIEAYKTGKWAVRVGVNWIGQSLLNYFKYGRPTAPTPSTKQWYSLETPILNVSVSGNLVHIKAYTYAGDSQGSKLYSWLYIDGNLVESGYNYVKTAPYESKLITLAYITKQLSKGTHTIKIVAKLRDITKTAEKTITV